MADHDFSKLEAVVEKLLAALKAARDENISLLARLQDKEQKIQALNADRAEVSGRVSSLIDSIENWQNNTTTEAPALFADTKEQGND